MVTEGGKMTLLEVKSSSTFHSSYTLPLSRAADIIGPSVPTGGVARCVIYGGEDAWDLKGTRVIPWDQVFQTSWG